MLHHWIGRSEALKFDILKSFNRHDRRKLWILATTIFVLTTGCRGRAQQELYDAQMAHEIRVLEDQLYEADYQNRILVDKIESLKLKGAAPFDPTSPIGGTTRPSIPDPIRNPGFQSRPSLPSVQNDPLIEAIDDLDAMIDVGTEEPLKPAPPSIEGLNPPPTELPAPIPQDPPATEESPQRAPREDKRLGFLPPSSPYSNYRSTTESEQSILNPPSSLSRNNDPSSLAISEKTAPSPLLAAPGGPEPPGKNSLIAPPVVPGDLLPPPGKEPEKLLPPGQILLPQSDNPSRPNRIKIHPSLSGGVNREGEVQQMMLVVNVLDQKGRPIRLADYDVNAELSVVLFDGVQEQSDSTRLGRWDFTPDQVNQLIKEDPISGFHIPIDWLDARPESKVIQAHVRVRSDEDDMRCSEAIHVMKQNAMTQWSPRGARTETYFAQ